MNAPQLICAKCRQPKRQKLRGSRRFLICDNCQARRNRELGDSKHPGRAERRAKRTFPYGTASRLARELRVCPQCVQGEMYAMKKGVVKSHRVAAALQRELRILDGRYDAPLTVPTVEQFLRTEYVRVVAKPFQVNL